MRAPLDESGEEYVRVVGAFESSLAPSDRDRFCVASVERLHNVDTHEPYALLVALMQKRERKRRKAGQPSVEAEQLERAWVYHGVASDAVENIIASGFNRSYAGKNATVYGPGCYFARDSSYSMRDMYSPPDENGVKHVFMCRLALGSHASVPRGYTDKEPPVRDTSRASKGGIVRHDCTTNGKLDAHGVPEVMV